MRDNHAKNDERGESLIRGTDYVLYCAGSVIEDEKGSFGIILANNGTGETKEYAEAYAGSGETEALLSRICGVLELLPEETSAAVCSAREDIALILTWEMVPCDCAEYWMRIDDLRSTLCVAGCYMPKTHLMYLATRLAESAASAPHPIPGMHPDTVQPEVPWNKAEAIENAKPSAESGKPGGAMGVDIRLPKKFMVQRTVMDAAQLVRSRRINPTCANNIKRFYDSESRKFRDYSNLKTGGADAWSSLQLSALVSDLEDGDDVKNALEQNLPQVKSREIAARWYRRGLTLHDAIRKALVDQEIGANAQRAGWR